MRGWGASSAGIQSGTSRGSVMLTSNLLFSKWEAIFKDPMTTAAAIDRLVHHSIILEMNVPSYRLEESQRNAEKQKD
jgi:DNA replication protein DnaC